jgi:hypothetical protein
MNSGSVSAGKSRRVTSSIGVLATSATGAKSVAAL